MRDLSGDTKTQGSHTVSIIKAMNRIAFVRLVWQNMLANGGMEKLLVPKLQITDVRSRFVRAELSIEAAHTNRLKIIHGGVLSALVDIGGSLALASEGMFMTGVTTDLATTFLAPGGKVGENITIDCYLNKLGRSMAFTSVNIGHLQGNELKLAARGNHTKYIVNALKSEQNVKPDWED